MKLAPFAMERLQSVWEHRVAWNVSESGVQPLRVDELIEAPEDEAAVFNQVLGYTQTNGTAELRSAIASMYGGAGIDHVQVTNGGSEANCIVLLHLVQPGDEFVVMTPNYMQIPGIARALGAEVRSWPLVADEAGERWRPDLDALERLVTDRTRAIAICNPNNPTGARLRAEEVDAVRRIASRVGAWLISDEIYRGAELDGVETPSAWGGYERTIVTSGLSKAYGLPGLRIGWVVAPTSTVEALWGVHDYTTIAPGALNDRLARIALAPGRREWIIARSRGIIRANYPALRRWIESRSPQLDHIAPEAGAIAFVRYHYPINSSALVDRLREQQGVLVVPGDHFEMDGYLRIGFGSDPGYLAATLERIGELLDGLPDAR